MVREALILKEILKTLKAQIMMSSIFSIVLGIAFIVWPLKITSIICRLMALVLIGMGIGQLARYTDSHRKTNGMAGILEILLGLWIFVRPGTIIEMIPIVIGIIIMIHGIQDAMYYMDNYNNGQKGWIGVLSAIINIMLALVLIGDSLGVVQLGTMLIGVILLYDGIKDLVFFVKVNR